MKIITAIKQPEAMKIKKHPEAIKLKFSEAMKIKNTLQQWIKADRSHHSSLHMMPEPCQSGT